MATLTLRNTKGSPLTNTELDGNFTALNTELGQKLVASLNLSDLANAGTARTNLGIGNVENKSSATIRSEITSSNVTTALGYTPLSLGGGTLTGAIAFAAGQTWPTFNQSTTGNAATATALQTARTINGVSFNGTANITVADSTKLALTGGTLTGKLNSAGSDSARLFESLNTSASNAIQFYIDHNLAATTIGNARGALNIVSPALTGTPTAPTAAANTNTTQVATTAFVSTAVGNVPVFAAGTMLMFAQAAAPTGWAQVTTDSATNRMLRVVNTAGAGVGGSHSPIINNVVPSHTHGFSTGGASANHTHTGETGTESSTHTHQFTAVTYSYYDDVIDTWSDRASTDAAQRTSTTTGQSTSHYHGFTTSGVSADHSHSGSTDNGSSQTNWTPRYIDMILCSKN
jgi:hypothetical protein